MKSICQLAKTYVLWLYIITFNFLIHPKCNWKSFFSEMASIWSNKDVNSYAIAQHESEVSKMMIKNKCDIIMDTDMIFSVRQSLKFPIFLLEWWSLKLLHYIMRTISVGFGIQQTEEGWSSWPQSNCNVKKLQKHWLFSCLSTPLCG